MKPETKLWHELKRTTPKITWTRLENTSLLGTPDLLGYNTSGHFFTVELKITSNNKIRFSPHQIAFHVTHPNNTFILAKKPSQGSFKLFSGTSILALVKEGFKNQDACCLMLEDLEKFFESLGDGRLRLVT
jgi:Holliday junction resolvase